MHFLLLHSFLNLNAKIFQLEITICNKKFNKYLTCEWYFNGIKHHNFMKKDSKSGRLKTFGPILRFYTNKRPLEFMIPTFHDCPLEPKITKRWDLLQYTHSTNSTYSTYQVSTYFLDCLPNYLSSYISTQYLVHIMSTYENERPLTSSAVTVMYS